MKIRLLTLMAAAVLAACGGGSGDNGARSNRQFEVVSFGDSLSDVGTYDVPGIDNSGPSKLNGGRYTTNPGSVWTERVARYYGGELKAASRGGFGLAERVESGQGYAQGGAKVSAAASVNPWGIIAKPVSRQIDAFQARNPGGFNDRQLVLLQGGGNDIVDAVLHVGQGSSVEGAKTKVAAAAVDLAAQVGRLTRMHANRVVLVNVPDLAITPLAVANPDLKQLMGELTLLFNDTVARELANSAIPIPPRFGQADAYRWIRDVYSHPVSSGFTVADGGMACDPRRIVQRAAALNLPNPTPYLQENGAALLCSADTLTAPNADQTYMFADELHPSTRLHELFAQFMERTIDDTVAKDIK